uniref:HicA toxin of toxin-antitoxin n=1 Tax=Candidatus Kentrum sp. SD TaxID=2126332 RepID=A0A450Z4B3_9GAMM|nr:MAG: hypothetical protein BECKSD772F_GA0070984_11325 [Candidatus Kentron sp. SD]VFK48626.1 MAG: hypothetical protein BECKSD772E_GA0070983_11335 [Candidatus Kentron sp. SD]VFK80667.1 MAG: hypothetical protein BECKSD772D_GA0070982_11393 [Candidatus Kentron sp. SD]
MPPFGPTSRKRLIRVLRSAGFDGPYAGGKHAFMRKEDRTLTLPNPPSPRRYRERVAGPYSPASRDIERGMGKDGVSYPPKMVGVRNEPQHGYREHRYIRVHVGGSKARPNRAGSNFCVGWSHHVGYRSTTTACVPCFIGLIRGKKPIEAPLFPYVASCSKQE